MDTAPPHDGRNDEEGKVTIISHLLIRDRATGRVILSKRDQPIQAPALDNDNG